MHFLAAEVFSAVAIYMLEMDSNCAGSFVDFKTLDVKEIVKDLYRGSAQCSVRGLKKTAKW